MGRRGNNEGSIYRRSDGRWVSYIRLPDGRKKFFYGQTRQSVQVRLTEALSARDQGTLITGPDVTVADLLERWLRDVVQPSVRYSTHRGYADHVRKVIPYVGAVKLSKLDGPKLQEAYNGLLKRGLSARSVLHVHRVLHRAMRQAVLWGLLVRNPVDAATPPKPRRTEMRTYTEEQVRQLLRATEGERWHELWALLITTGLRIGEALGLRWSDLDLVSGTAVIQRAAQRQVGRGVVFVEPKTSRSRRSVPLPAATCELLRRLRTRRQKEALAAGRPWSEAQQVFMTMIGTVPDATAILGHFYRAMDRAGLPRLRVHDLRHTAATHLLTHGVHPKVVQELLGHSTITLTLDTYSHVIPSLTREASTYMDVFFTTRAQKAKRTRSSSRDRFSSSGTALDSTSGWRPRRRLTSAEVLRTLNSRSAALVR